MRISVVGATGRIGARLTRALLEQGHQVKALSRGGPGLDALVALGAEPVLGSFDAGTGELGSFFREADAAFLMVKTDWNDLHGHYPKVARRFVDALRGSSVKLAVSLSAIGSDVRGSTGHFEGFHHLDETLDTLAEIDLVHLRAGWFMENLLFWAGAAARHERIGWSIDPAVKLPWIATRDIAGIAARELNDPTGERRVVREVGAEDLSMPEVATILAEQTGRPITYRFVDRSRKDIEAEFLRRFGTPERWLDDGQTLAALNDGRVRFRGHRDPLPTTLRAFVRDAWMPRYREALARTEEPESFMTWSAGA